MSNSQNITDKNNTSFYGTLPDAGPVSYSSALSNIKALYKHYLEDITALQIDGDGSGSVKNNHES
ncbi:MAG: hypothetical protein V1838_02655 [Patescibacteria group bacterium]